MVLICHVADAANIAQGFYDEPVLYDVLHGAGTAAEVTGLQRLCVRLGLNARGPWLEPACGSGRYLRVAAARGVRIAGFDLSEAMVEYARRGLGRLDAGLWRVGIASMEGFDAGELASGWRFELAFNPINTIRHLDSDNAMLEHLRRVHVALRPGGVYAVGLSMSVYGVEQASEDVWEGARGSLRVKQIVQYTPARGGRDRIEQVHNVLEVTRPTGTQIVPSSYALRSYDRSQWDAIIARSSFELIGCADEAGESMEPLAEGAPGYAIWLLMRS